VEGGAGQDLRTWEDQTEGDQEGEGALQGGGDAHGLQEQDRPGHKLGPGLVLWEPVRRRPRPHCGRHRQTQDGQSARAAQQLEGPHRLHVRVLRVVRQPEERRHPQGPDQESQERVAGPAQEVRPGVRELHQGQGHSHGQGQRGTPHRRLCVVPVETQPFSQPHPRTHPLGQVVALHLLQAGGWASERARIPAQEHLQRVDALVHRSVHDPVQKPAWGPPLQPHPAPGDPEQVRADGREEGGRGGHHSQLDPSDPGLPAADRDRVGEPAEERALPHQDRPQPEPGLLAQDVGLRRPLLQGLEAHGLGLAPGPAALREGDDQLDLVLLAAQLVHAGGHQDEDLPHRGTHPHPRRLQQRRQVAPLPRQTQTGAEPQVGRGVHEGTRGHWSRHGPRNQGTLQERSAEWGAPGDRPSHQGGHQLTRVPAGGDRAARTQGGLAEVAADCSHTHVGHPRRRAHLHHVRHHHQGLEPRETRGPAEKQEWGDFRVEQEEAQDSHVHLPHPRREGQGTGRQQLRALAAGLGGAEAAEGKSVPEHGAEHDPAQDPARVQQHPLQERKQVQLALQLRQLLGGRPRGEAARGRARAPSALLGQKRKLEVLNNQCVWCVSAKKC